MKTSRTALWNQLEQKKTLNLSRSQQSNNVHKQHYQFHLFLANLTLFLWNVYKRSYGELTEVQRLMSFYWKLFHLKLPLWHLTINVSFNWALDSWPFKTVFSGCCNRVFEKHVLQLQKKPKSNEIMWQWLYVDSDIIKCWSKVCCVFNTFTLCPINLVILQCEICWCSNDQMFWRSF